MSYLHQNTTNTYSIPVSSLLFHRSLSLIFKKPSLSQYLSAVVADPYRPRIKVLWWYYSMATYLMNVKHPHTPTHPLPPPHILDNIFSWTQPHNSANGRPPSKGFRSFGGFQRAGSGLFFWIPPTLNKNTDSGKSR